MDRPRYIPIFVRAYEVDFDRVALNPKLTHEEKVRLLVLLQHVWTDGNQIYSEFVSQEQLEAEITSLRSEIEQRMAA